MNRSISDLDSTGPESTQVHLDFLSKKEFSKLQAKLPPALANLHVNPDNNEQDVHLKKFNAQKK